jgi:hypothetical protein
VFYGFGPLVLIYGNQITRASVAQSFLYVTPEQLFRAHQLSTTGITIVLVGMLMHLYFSRMTWVTASQRISPAIDPYKLGLLFVVIGGVFKYLILKPASWGQIDLTVPGVLSNLSQLVDLGFAIIAFCAARGHGSARSLMMTILPFHLFLSTLSMSKLEIIIALLLPAIGAYVGHWNARRLFVHLIAIGAIFMVSQSYVSYGRDQIFDATGSIQEAGYIDRVEILSRYLFDDKEAASILGEGERRQGWWTRLNYAGPQARVMDLYDNGFANPMLHEMWIYFIPRVIWPEKPILYAPGLELYRLLTGHVDGFSFLGLSIYGDLYWQYGWSGVIFGCLIIGWVLGIATARSINAIRSQEYLMMPFVLLVLKTSMIGPNQFVISAFIGAVPIIVFWFLALWAATRFFGYRRHFTNTMGDDGVPAFDLQLGRVKPDRFG